MGPLVVLVVGVVVVLAIVARLKMHLVKRLPMERVSRLSHKTRVGPRRVESDLEAEFAAEAGWSEDESPNEPPVS